MKSDFNLIHSSLYPDHLDLNNLSFSGNVFEVNADFMRHVNFCKSLVCDFLTGFPFDLRPSSRYLYYLNKRSVIPCFLIRYRSFDFVVSYLPYWRNTSRWLSGEKFSRIRQLFCHYYKSSFNPVVESLKLPF